MALVLLATLIGSTLQSAAGFGFALVLAPAAFAAFDPDEAVTTLLVLGAELNLLVLFGERRRRQVLGGEIRILTAWAVPGLIGGAIVLGLLARPTLQVLVGALVVLAAVIQAGSRGRRTGPTSPRPDPRARAAAGVATGLLTTSTGASGPPLVLWLERIGATPAELRDSLSGAFLGLNALGALALIAPGGAGLDVDGLTVAVLLALTALGRFLGRFLFVRLDPARFRAVGLAIVLLTGLASVAAGLAG